MIERMLADHARLRACADCLEALLVSADVPDPESLAAARWALGSTMMQHLALEERHLYAALRDDPRAHVRRIAEAFQNDLVTSFGPYADHAKSWTPERVSGDWDTYRTQTLALLQTMRARMTREETELYPLVERNGIDTRHSGLPGRNWTREAFVIKERIGGR